MPQDGHFISRYLVALGASETLQNSSENSCITIPHRGHRRRAFRCLRPGKQAREAPPLERKSTNSGTSTTNNLVASLANPGISQRGSVNSVKRSPRGECTQNAL